MTSFYIIGKLIEEPELSISSNGVKIAKFRVCVASKNKEMEPSTDIHELVGFNNLAQETYEVGQLMYFQGRFQANNFKKDDSVF